MTKIQTSVFVAFGLCGVRSLWRSVFVAFGLCGVRSLWRSVFVAFGLCGVRSLWRSVFVAFGLCGVVFLEGCEKTSSKSELNHVAKNEVLFFLNSRPVAPNAYRVLFIGDSLTCHGPQEKVWDMFNGMAASSYELDFVHLFAARLQADLGPATPVEIFLVAAGPMRNMIDQIKCQPNLMPDLVIFQGGENDAFNEEFKREYRQLLSSFKTAGKQPKAIVLGDWWNGEKAQFDYSVAQEDGFEFVDINQIFKRPECSGDGGPYGYPGVSIHPNDRGMQEISKAMAATFEGKILQSLSSVTPKVYKVGEK